MSSFAENRKFFLEIIDDMAKSEATFAELMELGPEHWEKDARWDEAWEAAVAEAEQGTAREESARECSPEWFREQMEQSDDRELLLHRRITAKLICEQVASTGLYMDTMHETLLAAVERLRIMDVEIARRNLDRRPPATG